MANVGIVGYGFVGKATDYSLREYHNIIFYDKFKEEDTVKGVTRRRHSLEEVVDHSEFIFVCLPTPFSQSREEIDLSIVDENAGKIAKLSNSTDKIIVVKSTVIPGTTERYANNYNNCNFCFNPEFLREATYLEDAVNPDRIIIGVNNHKVYSRVRALFAEGFPDARMFKTDFTTAETVKYMNNAFLAMKVIFANEIHDLCNRLGISYEEVKNMVVADRRIHDSHLDITSERGFGGKCFPKDMVALIGLCKKLGVDASLLETAWHKNLKIRRHRDWEDIPFAVSD